MKRLCAALLCLAILPAGATARADDTPAMATAAAAGIGIPEGVDTRIGALRFFDGFPDSATIKAAYDYLDFLRGVEVVLHAAPAAAGMAVREALRSAGAGNGALALADASSLPELAAPDRDAHAVSALGWLDLRKGAMVVEMPTDAAIALADGWGRAVTLGDTGEGATTKMLVLPPGYKGKVAAGYSVAMPRSHGVFLEVRAAESDATAAADALRAGVRVYPLAQSAKPPRNRFVTLADQRPPTATPSPLRAFERIDRIVQEEPAEAMDPEIAAMLDAIGMRKGKPFRPDGRMKALLAEAAAFGEGAVRTTRAATRESVADAPVDTARVEPESEGPIEGVEGRVGKLTFEGGVPTPDTVRLIYDNLDFMRGVEAWLASVGGAATAAWQAGLAEAGVADGTLGIFENAMDAKALVLTGDTEAVYVVGYVDLSAGPVVLESPPGMQGEVRTAWSQRLVALGVTGPDKGKGGRYLLLPPGYTGAVPKQFQALRSPTFGNLVWWRGMRLRGDPEPAIDNARRNARIYPLSQPRPVEGAFVNLSGRELNTLAATDVGFFEQVAKLVQREPAESLDPGAQGALAGLGIARGATFAPDARTKAILEEAAVVGDAIARSVVFASRFPELFPWPKSQWQRTDAQAAAPFARTLEARIRSAYYVEGFAEAMATRGESAGMQSALVVRDAKGEGLDGGKNYRLRLPPRIPANRGWTLVPYDNQTRSMLQTDERFPGIGGRREGLRRNPDGSIDVFFGPQAPAGKNANWVQTRPDKGWSLVLRLFHPTETWYTKAWRPGEIEPVK